MTATVAENAAEKVATATTAAGCPCGRRQWQLNSVLLAKEVSGHIFIFFN